MHDTSSALHLRDVTGESYHKRQKAPAFRCPKLKLPEHRVTAPASDLQDFPAITSISSIPLPARFPRSGRCRLTPSPSRSDAAPSDKGAAVALYAPGRPGGGGTREADRTPPARPDADPEWARSPAVAMATGPSAALALGQPPPPSQATVGEGGGAATGSTLSPNPLPSALPRAPALPPRPALTGGLGGLGGGAPTAGTILRAGAQCQRAAAASALLSSRAAYPAVSTRGWQQPIGRRGFSPAGQSMNVGAGRRPSTREGGEKNTQGQSPPQTP